MELDFDPWGFFVAVVLIVFAAVMVLYTFGIMFPDTFWRWW